MFFIVFIGFLVAPSICGCRPLVSTVGANRDCSKFDSLYHGDFDGALCYKFGPYCTKEYGRTCKGMLPNCATLSDEDCTKFDCQGDADVMLHLLIPLVFFSVCFVCSCVCFFAPLLSIFLSEEPRIFKLSIWNMNNSLIRDVILMRFLLVLPQVLQLIFAASLLSLIGDRCTSTVGCLPNGYGTTQDLVLAYAIILAVESVGMLLFGSPNFVCKGRFSYLYVSLMVKLGLMVSAGYYMIASSAHDSCSCNYGFFMFFNVIGAFITTSMDYIRIKNESEIEVLYTFSLFYSRSLSLRCVSNKEMHVTSDMAVVQGKVDRGDHYEAVTIITTRSGDTMTYRSLIETFGCLLFSKGMLGLLPFVGALLGLYLMNE